MADHSSGSKASPLKRLSTADFLEENGVGEFGTASVFQGEWISKEAERSRLREVSADGDARRRLELLNFLFKDVVGILLVISLAVSSSFILFDKSLSAQDREWARSMLSAIGGAVAGYVFGKGSRKS
ncbi:MAG: hypothetical protein AAGN15_20750 [Cyanobacteria bacterium J06581_3]